MTNKEHRRVIVKKKDSPVAIQSPQKGHTADDITNHLGLYGHRPSTPKSYCFPQRTGKILDEQAKKPYSIWQQCPELK
jgi:hypothetical protein